MSLLISTRMREPSLRTSRLVIAAAFLAAIAIGTAGFFVGRATSPRLPAPPDAVPQPPPTASPAPAEQPRILRRADIIALVDRAADAAASRSPLPREILGLAGRRFELAIPFGCDGPSAADGDAYLGWRYDAERQTLRIHVSQTVWQADEWDIAQSSAPPQVAEGFWVGRPWSSSETCPQGAGRAIVPGPQPVTLPGQTLAIAQFRSEDPDDPDSASRSFDAVKRIPSEELNADRGFRLRLTGRIDKLPDGQPVRCIQPAGSEQRPICVLAVSFEELRIENPASADVLAIWSLENRRQGD